MQITLIRYYYEMRNNGRKQSGFYAYSEYLDLLIQGTESS